MDPVLDYVYGPGAHAELEAAWQLAGEAVLPGTEHTLEVREMPHDAVEIHGLWWNERESVRVGEVRITFRRNDIFMLTGTAYGSDLPYTGMYTHLMIGLVPWMRSHGIEWLEIPMVNALGPLLLGTGWEKIDKGRWDKHAAFLDLTREETEVEEYLEFKKGKRAKPSWYKSSEKDK